MLVQGLFEEVGRCPETLQSAYRWQGIQNILENAFLLMGKRIQQANAEFREAKVVLAKSSLIIH